MNTLTRAFARTLTAAQLAAMCACAQLPASKPCKPPEAMHLLIDPDTGQPVVPEWVGRLRDGVDYSCPSTSAP